MIGRLLERLLDAAAYMAAALRREPIYYHGCPYDGICDRCPAADDDDACTPDERRAFELCEKYAGNRN